MSVVGYARVSTSEQSVDAQRELLTAAGAVKVFVDEGVSGRIASRPGLDAALDYLREGDVLTVQRLDRLGRSTRNVLTLLYDLEERGVGFRSLAESIDTTGPMGRLMVTLLAAFSQLEADVTRERTMVGLAHAAAQGRRGGRRPSLSPAMVKVARSMADSGDGVTKIAAQLGVSRATIYRSIATD